MREPIDETVLRAAKLDGAIIRLRRNVGHQKAIAIGLSYLSQYVLPDQAIIVMDSDGEDLPVSIAQLVAALDDPQVDITVAQRRRRVETLKFKGAYVLYKLLFKLLTGRNINFGNFMAMKAGALKRLAAMQELPIHLAASALVSKLRIKPIIIGARWLAVFFHRDAVCAFCDAGGYFEIDWLRHAGLVLRRLGRFDYHLPPDGRAGSDDAHFDGHCAQRQYGGHNRF